MNKQHVSKPLPPLPYTLLTTHASTYIQLPNGMVQVLTQGERSQLITRAAFERVAQIFNQ